MRAEHPTYAPVVCCFDRVPASAKAKPEPCEQELFGTLFSGDRDAMTNDWGRSFVFVG